MNIQAAVGDVRGEVTLTGRAEVQVVLTDLRDELTITDELRLASAAAREALAERFPPPVDSDALAVLERLALKMPRVEVPPAAKVTQLATVQVERVEWLWPGRIPRGKLSLVEGHPGVGKSQLTMALAAAVSRGAALPGGTTAPPADVLLLSAEDAPGDTLRPRLEAAGGDPDRVHVLESITGEDGTPRFPELPGDLLVLANTITQLKAKLVIIDPLTAYLAGSVNSWRDSDIRRALAPLAALAQAMGVAIVVVRHLTKAITGQAITAGGGSIAIIGAARVALLIAKDPNDDERRILAVVKSNIAKHPPALAFRLTEQPSGWSAVVFEGESSHTADDLIAAGRDTEDRSQRDEAKDFLADMLRDGPVASDEVLRESKKLGHAQRTIERVRRDLKVESFKEGRRWFLRLPAAVNTAKDRQNNDAPLYPENRGGLDEKQGISDVPTETSNSATAWRSSVAVLTDEGNGRPRCSLCSGPLVKRRSGMMRCPKCVGSTVRDPYIEPLPAGTPAA
jgi:hypothetical protein